MPIKPYNDFMRKDLDYNMNLNEKQMPNLLVITINAWSDVNSTGNTISNHFGNWDKHKVSNVFLRDEEIDNDCCTSYFRICEKDILNSLFSRKQLGVEVQQVKENKKKLGFKTIKNTKIKEFLIRKRPMLVLLLREIFWFIGFRKKSKLDEFLNRSNPEIIHIHTPTLIYGHRVLHYCHKKTRAKVVLFFGDELYDYKTYWPFDFLYQSILRYWVRKTIKIASINYAATPELCDYYSSIFGKEFKVLYKGTSIVVPHSKPHPKPLKIVYAGNLLYNRWKTLALLSKAIEQVSNNQEEFELMIYSATPLSKKMNDSLNSKHATVLGAKPFHEIKKIMQDADIVLHVESFEKKYMNITKYSFSTKIVDCIQSGSCIMGIGPKELASINFLTQSEAAVIANSFDEIVMQLQKIILNHILIDDYIFKMHNFTKNIFDLNLIRENIQKDLMESLLLNRENS